MDDAARNRIAAKLRLLARRGRPRSEVGPPATRESLEAFEARHGVDLPTGYRRFLVEIGEGGAGPGWGLVTLSGWADAWSDVGEPDLLSPSYRVALPDTGELDPNRLRSQLRGFITLADQGAERWWLLEVAGEQPGRVWRWESLESVPEPFVPFADWYERWLDESIAGLDDASFGAFQPGTDTALLLRTADPAPSVRADTAGELGRRLEPSDAVRTALRQLMRDPSPEVRAAALRHGERVVNEADVLEGLRDENVAVQRVAAFRLRRGSPRPPHDALRAHLHEVDDPTVLSLVGQTLGEAGELPVRVLETALAHADPSLRARAVRLLEWANPRHEADEGVDRALDDPAADVRTAAVCALAGHPDAKARLQAHRGKERDPDVIAALMRELEALEDDL